MDLSQILAGPAIHLFGRRKAFSGLYFATGLTLIGTMVYLLIFPDGESENIDFHLHKEPRKWTCDVIKSGHTFLTT